MNELSPNDRRRVLAALCLIVGPGLLVIADLLSRHRLTYLTLMGGACIFLLPSTFAVAHLLRARADWFGLIGVTFSLIGLMAYYGMMAVYRFQEVIQGSGITGVAPDAIQLVLQTEPRLYGLTFLPAFLWPLGLLILSIGLIRDGRFVLIGCMLGLGALFFALNRQWGLTVVGWPGDLLIFAALVWLGIRLFREPSLWAD